MGPGENCPALSRDGRYLSVFESSRARLHVWKLAGAEPQRVFPTPVRAFFSPDSRQLALQEPDGSISLFDLARGTRVRRLPKVPRVNHFAWHPSSRQLALACESFVQVCDLKTGKVLWQKDLAALRYRWAEWHPDGKTLAVEDGEAISLWDVAQDQQIGKLEGIPGGGLNFTFNPAGTVLVNTGWAGILSLWDPLAGRQLFATQTRMQNPAPQFSDDGRFLAATQHDQKLCIWEMAAGNEYRNLMASPLKGKRSYRSVAISTEGRFLAAGADGGIALWDLPTGKELAFLEGSPFNFVAFEHGSPPKGVEERPEATLLTMEVNGLFRRPIRGEPGTGAVHIGPAQRLPVPGANAHFVQSRDGRVLASAQGQGALVWHTDRPDQLIKLEPHDDVRKVAVSPNGRWVATGRFSYPGGAKIWEVGPMGKPPTKGPTYKLVKDLPGGGNFCWPVFSSDGKRLLTSGAAEMGPVRRWEVEIWVEIPFKEPIEGIVATFSPDGKLVVLETGLGVARLIDADTGKEYARLEDPNQHRADHFAFTPDGTKLVCATGEGYCVHIWDLQAIRRVLAEMNLDW